MRRRSLVCLGSAHLDELGEGLVDEDEGDEEGEDLLGEGRDVAHQEAALGRHHDQHDETPSQKPIHTRPVRYSKSWVWQNWVEECGYTRDEMCSVGTTKTPTLFHQTNELW